MILMHSSVRIPELGKIGDFVRALRLKRSGERTSSCGRASSGWLAYIRDLPGGPSPRAT